MQKVRIIQEHYRTDITPGVDEVLIVSDDAKVYVGDGSTPGGVLAFGTKGDTGDTGPTGPPGPTDLTLTNQTGSNTVKGYIYVLDPTNPEAVSAPAPLGSSYLIATGSEYVICVGGGVPNGSPDLFATLDSGKVIEVYSDAAAAVGDWMNLPPAVTGNVGQGNPNAATNAGRTVGKCVQAAGPGLVKVKLGKVWA